MFGFRSRTNHKVACVTASERGLVRKDNQDSLFVDAAKTFFCVADGMGGGAEGGTASRFVCEEVEKAAVAAGFSARLKAVDAAIPDVADRRTTPVLRINQQHRQR